MCEKGPNSIAPLHYLTQVLSILWQSSCILQDSCLSKSPHNCLHLTVVWPSVLNIYFLFSEGEEDSGSVMKKVWMDPESSFLTSVLRTPPVLPGHMNSPDWRRKFSWKSSRISAHWFHIKTTLRLSRVNSDRALECQTPAQPQLLHDGGS